MLSTMLLPASLRQSPCAVIMHVTCTVSRILRNLPSLPREPRILTMEKRREGREQSFGRLPALSLKDTISAREQRFGFGVVERETTRFDTGCWWLRENLSCFHGEMPALS